MKEKGNKTRSIADYVGGRSGTLLILMSLDPTTHSVVSIVGRVTSVAIVSDTFRSVAGVLFFFYPLELRK